MAQRQLSGNRSAEWRQGRQAVVKGNKRVLGARAEGSGRSGMLSKTRYSVAFSSVGAVGESVLTPQLARAPPTHTHTRRRQARVG